MPLDEVGKIAEQYGRENAGVDAVLLPCSCFIMMLCPPESEAEIRALAGCGCGGAL